MHYSLLIKIDYWWLSVCRKKPKKREKNDCYKKNFKNLQKVAFLARAHAPLMKKLHQEENRANCVCDAA